MHQYTMLVTCCHNYVRNTGCLVYFLPPYSPDLNPIEYLFSKVKSVLKANDQAWSDYTVQTAVTIAVNCITEEDCQANQNKIYHVRSLS